ncbi:hypothetical protein JFQ88_004085 [Aeromonas dhakensis]|nr:hypothetical protein [Aeromonas dhakensis]
MTDRQEQSLAHEQWVEEQEKEAFDKVEAGEARFTEHEDAKEAMAKRKAAIKARK